MCGSRREYFFGGELRMKAISFMGDLCGILGFILTILFRVIDSFKWKASRLATDDSLRGI